MKKLGQAITIFDAMQGKHMIINEPLENCFMLLSCKQAEDIKTTLDHAVQVNDGQYITLAYEPRIY